MLKGKKILVAGASGLLGINLVIHLLKQGAFVIALDIDLSRLKTLLQDVDECIVKDNIGFITADLTDEAAVIKTFESLKGLDGAVNCSYPRNANYGRSFFEVGLKDFNENVSLSLGAAFLFSQQCANYFKKEGTPFSLVNISSVYGVVAPKFEIYENTKMTMPVEYAAIKSALIHLSKYITSYVSDSKFKINVVSPGGILDKQPSEFLRSYEKKTLGKGMLDVDDVLGAIIFLLSPMAEFVNGQNIVVDDGFTLF